MSATQITLVLGGARSGKSAFAETLLMREPPPWRYIATAELWDEEMRERAAEHVARRAAGWQTEEAPLQLAAALNVAVAQPVLVDCLTLWLSNLLLSEHDIDAASNELATALARRDAATVLVANEVGFGIVPDNPLARRFRDAAGRLNQRLAAQADRVVLVVAGLPMLLKGTL